MAVLQNMWLRLWFGDERGYNATINRSGMKLKRCGLVMKEDITQPSIEKYNSDLVVVW